MSSPHNPLTRTPPPALDWSRKAAPTSTDFDDIYFSVDGGIEETKTVFLNGCGLPDGWQARDRFIIGELGFGSGLNFLTTWELWNRTAPSDSRLHFISVEAFPWCAADLRKVYEDFRDLRPFSDQLIEQWPGPVKGFHRLQFGNVALTLLHMEILDALNALNPCPVNAWFLDGFSPAKNPDMWSQAVFDALAGHSAFGARLATFTVSGQVRRGLQQAGFSVEKRPGFGRKRQRLEASFQGPAIQGAKREINKPPVIIGSGIAGASIARAYVRRGITPVLIDPEPDLKTAASGNPAALIMPRLDLQDRPESRFFLSAYLYATAQYRESGSVLQTGTVQLAKSADELRRFDKIIDQEALPRGQMQAVTKAEARDKTGLELAQPYGGLYFPGALTIDPVKTIREWTRTAKRIDRRAAKIEKTGDTWRVLDATGDLMAESETVFLAAGAELLTFESTKPLGVRFTRGQISWGPHPFTPDIPLIAEIYAIPLEGSVLLGATHEHVGAGQNARIRTEDNKENIENYVRISGQKPPVQNWNARASVRVTTRDTLPVSTWLADGLCVLSGLGARGFMMAPLLGEALVSEAVGDPLPLSAQTKVRFGTREKI